MKAEASNSFSTIPKADNKSDNCFITSKNGLSAAILIT